MYQDALCVKIKINSTSINRQAILAEMALGERGSKTTLLIAPLSQRRQRASDIFLLCYRRGGLPLSFVEVICKHVHLSGGRRSTELDKSQLLCL